MKSGYSEHQIEKRPQPSQISYQRFTEFQIQDLQSSSFGFTEKEQPIVIIEKLETSYQHSGNQIVFLQQSKRKSLHYKQDIQQSLPVIEDDQAQNLQLNNYKNSKRKTLESLSNKFYISSQMNQKEDKCMQQLTRQSKQLMKINDKDKENNDQNVINSFNRSQNATNRIVDYYNKLQLKIRKNNTAFMYFKPQFTLIDPQQDIILLFANKDSPFTILIFKEKGNYDENSQYCIGKLVSNFMGTLMNFYQKCQLLKGQAKYKLKCTIQLSNSCTLCEKPRNIYVYLNNSLKSQSNSEIQSYTSIKELYQKQNGMHDTLYLQSRMPLYNPKAKIYHLQMGGRAKISSIKNFILQDPTSKGRNSLLFGLINNHEYNLDITYPFNPLVAFAIALANFNGNLFFQ